MLLVNKHKILIYNKKKYKCSIGLNGLTNNKVEGDKKTPMGTYSLGELFVRTDRIKNLKTKYKFIPIKNYMAWSDDPNDLKYNQLIETKNYHKESLYRDDNLYNLILTINYNTNPVIPNKGSAIFLHVSTNDYKPTNGCIAINANDFIEILELIDINEKINIS